MKKGRHRRYEEARAVKRSSSELRLEDVGFQEGGGLPLEPCPECAAQPGDPHAVWCLHEEELAEVDES